jgi:hypothetical protein
MIARQDADAPIVIQHTAGGTEFLTIYQHLSIFERARLI